MIHRIHLLLAFKYWKLSAINTKCRIVYGSTGMVDYSKAAMKMLLKILVEQEGINSCQINRKLRNCTCKERKRLSNYHLQQVKQRKNQLKKVREQPMKINPRGETKT